jgi:Fic family protein
MKTYERTHKWLTFRCDLSRAPAPLWLLLGEAASKCDHLSQVPLRPSTAQQLHQLYLAKGVAATTAIEGNTLTEEEVLLAVRGELTVPPSRQYLKQEVDNIISACNKIRSQLSTNQLPKLTPALFSEYNKQVLESIPLKDDVVAGAIRNYSVVVGNVYRGAPNEDCPYLLERLCDWLNGPDFQAPPSWPKGQEVSYAILKAVIAHLYFAWIHPFGDGNGRSARLLEFHILMSAGIPSPASHLLSNHYNQTRSEYYRQLDMASKTGGEIVPFVLYAVQGFVDGLREQLTYIWEQQWDVVWRNYVHERFQDKHSESDRRRNSLALDLGVKKDWILASAIPELTPRLAKAYAVKTPKAIQRDLNELEKLNLVVRDGRKVRANREIILSFLPLRRIQE